MKGLWACNNLGKMEGVSHFLLALNVGVPAANMRSNHVGIDDIKLD